MVYEEGAWVFLLPNVCQEVIILCEQYYLFRESGDPLNHHSDYDFNDDLIKISSEFWLEIAKDRLFL